MKIAAEIQIGPATAANGPAIAALLRAAELPHEDCAAHLGNFLVARAADGAIVGAVGAEVCGADALLRSLVVDATWRGAGLGSRLVAALERAAAAWGVRRWWLLTTTAETFFAARGFRVADRSEAPETIQRTGQFSGGGCSSAVCMMRERRSES
ncbi:MAG TPA: arsenic resistance N-acetyltransferase ArsN2 [Opitutaceae bacterium]|nr:arsenic resistance N-acetyltransferase ArsN2 [Opitutaceae bacterium]